MVRATGLVLAPAVSSFAERERLKVARSGSALTAHRAVIHYRPVKSCYAIVLNKDGRREGIRPYMVAGEGLEPPVLHFRCGENAAVGSAALTVHRTVIHYRLTLRVIRPSVS